jgi:surfeit locus 1 family protein
MIIRRKLVVGLLLYGLVLCILAGLGTWQFLRGRDKATIESITALHPESVILDAAPADWEPLAYRRVLLEGTWLEGRQFLLQNRIYRGTAGFEVLTPFILEDSGMVLVNRGWVAAGAAAELSNAEPVRGSPEGMAYRPQTGFTLGDAIAGQPVWPQPALYLDLDALSRRFGQTFEPMVLVLDETHPAAFVRLWHPTNMSASRHYGYAVQWWGLMATLLVFGYIWQRNRSPGDQA